MLIAYDAGSRQMGFAVSAVSAIVTDLAFVSLVLFFLWRNGEPFDRCGLGHTRFVREIVLGVLLYPFIGVLIALLDALFESLGLSQPPTTTLASRRARRLAARFETSDDERCR